MREGPLHDSYRYSPVYSKAMEEGAPVLEAGGSDVHLTERLLAPLWRGGAFWKISLLLTGGGAIFFFLTLLYTALTGIGVWGNNIPVAWAFAITNFVWWIGIGHAGTFISAVLLLLEQNWRNSINRLAEAMTLFAIINAALFPLIHLGRPWFAYWIFPYPSTMSVWPNFKGALPWDAAAISTYFTVSLLFWYVGLLPDLASARDHAPTLAKKRIYGLFALGWRGSGRSWKNWQMTYLLLGGLATPLVLSVHSVVSLDFAITQLPGWHSTIFPPYFVAGAIYSGFAMVLTLMLPMRALYGIKDIITTRHLDAMAKLILVTGTAVYYTYAVELFIAWYTGNIFESQLFLWIRLSGPYAWSVWLTFGLNFIVPNLMWFRAFRQNPILLWIASILVNVAMWFERFFLIITSQAQDFLPSSWALYKPTYIDGAIFLGTFFLFGFLFLLFLRFVPFIPISETKELRHALQAEEARLRKS